MEPEVIVNGSTSNMQEPVPIRQQSEEKKKRCYVSRKEQEFFLLSQKRIEQLQQNVQGAILLIAYRQELRGDIKLSDDASEIYEE